MGNDHTHSIDVLTFDCTATTRTMQLLHRITQLATADGSVVRPVEMVSAVCVGGTDKSTLYVAEGPLDEGEHLLLCVDLSSTRINSSDSNSSSSSGGEADTETAKVTLLVNKSSHYATRLCRHAPKKW